MNSFRSKPVGWRHESYRHYLAAKGYFTKLKDAPYVTLYHGTQRNRLDSIREHGLIPYLKRHPGHVEKRPISLTPSVKIAKSVSEYGPEVEMDRFQKSIPEGMMDDEYIEMKRQYDEDREPVVLKVTVPREFIDDSIPSHWNKGFVKTASEFLDGWSDVGEKYPRLFVTRHAGGPYEFKIDERIPPKHIEILPEKELFLRVGKEDLNEKKYGVGK